MRCFQNRKLSSHAMRCLAEVAAITTLDDHTTPLPAPATDLLAKLFNNVTQLLTKMVPPSTVVRLATDGWVCGCRAHALLCARVRDRSD